MTIKATLKVTKAQTKSNITGTISYNEDGSFRSYNITGNLVELKNYVTRDGVDLSNELVQIDCPTTALLFNQTQGEAVVEKCAEIFANRAAKGDLNPAIDLIIEAKSVRPRETNILIVNIKSIFVDADTQIVDRSDNVLDTIAKLKANSAKSNAQTSIARQSANFLNKAVTKTREFIKQEF